MDPGQSDKKRNTQVITKGTAHKGSKSPWTQQRGRSVSLRPDNYKHWKPALITTLTQRNEGPETMKED